MKTEDEIQQRIDSLEEYISTHKDSITWGLQDRVNIYRVVLENLKWVLNNSETVQ